MEKDIKVDVYVLCYNEEKLVPFMLDYWNEFATNVYVLDNQSTDKSVELLLAETRFNVEIISYQSNNELNDAIYLELKNNVWKRSIGKCDFVVVCDFDEALFGKNIMNELSYMKENNQTICFPTTFNMFSNDFPSYNKNMLLHDVVKTGVDYYSFGKRVLFNPNQIKEINYDPGAHSCHPIGNIRYYDKNNIYLFHFKYLSIEYVLNRYALYRNRLSEVNKKYKWGFQYNDEDNKTIKYFNSELSRCININSFLI